MDQSQQKTDAIYARQSVDKADSISIESQIEYCRYETRGAPCMIFTDRGYSGKNTDRPGFQQLLAAVRSGKIRRVICYKLDRCSRSILDFTTLMEEFQTNDVEFVSCTEKFDTSTPIGRAMLNICIVFAQLERETIQQRVSDAYHSRCKKGFYMGGKVPFGFRLVPCTVAGKQSACYEEDPSEARILRLMYEAYQDPSTSLADLVQMLRQMGIENPRRADGKWVRSHIGRMLRNPVYVKADQQTLGYFRELGVAIHNLPEDYRGIHGCYLYSEQDRKTLVLAPHKGLIPSEIWLRCRKKHTPSGKRSPGPSGWLTGKLICGYCGHRIVISKSGRPGGKTYRYLICPQSHGTHRCCPGLHGWKAETAEQLIGQLLQKKLEKLYWEVKSDNSAKAKRTAGNPPDYRDLWLNLSDPGKKQVADLLIGAVTIKEGAMALRWLL